MLYPLNPRNIYGPGARQYVQLLLRSASTSMCRHIHTYVTEISLNATFSNKSSHSLPIWSKCPALFVAAACWLLPTSDDFVLFL